MQTTTIQLPLLPPEDSDVDVFLETEHHVHPIAFGYDTLLEDLRNNRVKAIQAMVYFTTNYLSNWQSGKSQYVSISRFSELIGVSPSYISTSIQRAGRWLKKLNRDRRGTRYQVKRAGQDGSDTSTFAVPYGFGSPMDKLFKGIISWKACLIWIMLKFDSNWTTGLTSPTNMLKLAKVCGFGAGTVCDCIKELTAARLLERTTPVNEPAVYQLYPKPKAKSKSEVSDTEADPHASENGYSGKYHFYSRNRQYRICYESGTIEKRFGKGKNDFKRCSDFHIAQQIPKAIINALTEALEIRRSINTALRSSLSAAATQ